MKVIKYYCDMLHLTLLSTVHISTYNSGFFPHSLLLTDYFMVYFSYACHSLFVEREFISKILFKSLRLVFD